MPRPKSEFDVQMTFRIPRAWLECADALRAHVSKDGLNVTRTDVLRVALVAGLAKLEGD